MLDSAPTLIGDARAAVKRRGSHLQIIASAGSGKTEVISQRVVDLLAEDVPPEAIVAFTFTEKAAESLKARIQERAAERLGDAVLGRLAPMYVGTIHAYSFRLLQTYVPRYEAFDVLDENRLAAFLAREGRTLGVKQLDANQRLFASIQTFIANLEVVENELIPGAALIEPFASVYGAYLDRLDAFRLLTFGQLTARAVAELERPRVREAVQAPLRHLIVDEYQDVNPAQERLIELLTGERVELCVVGDDDQAIYQWRGTDVRNIVEFTTRHPGAATFPIGENWRSRPGIVELANRCSAGITGRLSKAMDPTRDPGADDVVLWTAASEREQAETIADAIDAARRQGYGYRDVAILLRSRTSLPVLLEVLDSRGIPVRPDGRTNLFLQRDAQTFGRLCAFLAGHGWRPEQYGGEEPVTLDGLTDGLLTAFGPGAGERRQIRRFLARWRAEVTDPSERSNLVRDFYLLLELLGVHGWDLGDPSAVTRLGTLARCSQILADYESVARRARIDATKPGELIGGQDRGEWYYRWLAIFVQNYAFGAYQDFDGEDDVAIDAVQIGTIHRAKGLEWPIVFVPSVIGGRLPSQRIGQARAEWFVPTSLFSQDRYNGTLGDERRLLYVALTRARDQLLVSSFNAHASGRPTGASSLFSELYEEPPAHRLTLPAAPAPKAGDVGVEPLELSVSDLVAYQACGMSYRLRTLLGFQPTLATELGYGRAVHHVLREVAEHVRRTRRTPDTAELDRLFDDEFFLPAATKATHNELKRAGRRLVDRYLADYAEDLHRIWAVERPFELRLDTAIIAGRADVILDDGAGETTPSLTLVDYKTAGAEADAFDFQLQVYADAGRGEGLDVASAVVHDLKRADRRPVDVSGPQVDAARTLVRDAVEGIREQRFDPKPGIGCARCDVAPICAAARRRR